MKSNGDQARGKDKGKPSCKCPFCDAPMEAAYPFCGTCGREIRRCPVCGKVLAIDEKTCARCK